MSIIKIYAFDKGMQFPIDIIEVPKGKSIKDEINKHLGILVSRGIDIPTGIIRHKLIGDEFIFYAGDKIYEAQNYKRIQYNKNEIAYEGFSVKIGENTFITNERRIEPINENDIVTDIKEI